MISSLLCANFSLWEVADRPQPVGCRRLLSGISQPRSSARYHSRMKTFSISSLAVVGALASLYSAACAGISLRQGVFQQDWKRMEMVDMSPQLQSPRLIELLHAARDSSHSTMLVFSQIASIAQESAVRTLIVSTACFLFF